MTARQIIALGGGGFSMEPDNPLLDNFILSRARRTRPRVCFVGTASGDAPAYLTRFYRAFSGRDCIPTDLTLFNSGTMSRRPERTEDIASFVFEQDVLYVGGGNTANLLALWRMHGIDRAIRAAWEAGTVLCGVSAGMICWFASSITDSFGPFAPLHDGLALLPFSACPHYDGEADRQPLFHALIAGGAPTGFAADDSAALCFRGTELDEVVTSEPDVAGYRVALRDGALVEERLPSRYLG
jgi:dipeptidase E